jgi:hypothetical protein
MGFLAGRASFDRFRIESPEGVKFGQAQVDALTQFAIGQVESASPDEAVVGFTAGQHLLDTAFSVEKNVLDDALHFGVRIDTNKVPAALRKAWLQIELTELGAENSSGRPTKAQRQQAKEAVDARCEDESREGKFRRMQHVSVLWDARESTLYLGGASPATAEQCIGLLERAFELSLERVTAGRLATRWCSENKKMAALDSVVPSAFHGDGLANEIAWVSDPSANFDFLGNEFLLWLWWSWETVSDALELSDGSEVVGMLNRTLSLECPHAQSGKETISAEAPVRLPEAMLAVSAGKLPRKSGFTLVRQDMQHEFVLQAETLSVGGARTLLSEGDDSDDGDIAMQRIDGLRHLVETIDLLFGVFCQRRLGKSWAGDLDQIRRWLQKNSGPSKRSAA